MTPTQYINIMEERLQALNDKAKAQKSKAQALGLRQRFQEIPSSTSFK